MMNITSTNFQNKSQSKLSFGRALTTAESNLLENSLSKGLKKADIKTLAINLPVAAAPAQDNKNTGIGNFSEVAGFMKEIKPLTGFNTALFLPLGSSYDYNNSPFSTDSFGLNHGYFDPSKLKTEEYGNLLNPDNQDDQKVLADLYNAPVKNPEKTEYSNTVKIEAVLNRAYENYQQGLEKENENCLKLQEEFDDFKNNETQKYWLDTYAKEKDAADPERYKFKQFLLEKQRAEMTEELKNQGIDTIIDIPVGANRGLDAKLEKDDPFLNRELGAFDGSQGKWVGWGIIPLNPGKKSAQELSYQKARYHASLGTGVRLDCFNGNMFAADGNGVLPEYNANPTILANQLFYGIRDGGTDPGKSFAEHLPYQEKYDAKVVDNYLKKKSKEILGTSIPKLSVAKWNHFGNESFDSNGSHEISGYHQDCKGKPEAIKDGFTTLLSRGTKKIMLPFTDVFGIEEPYNVSNTVNDTNWTKRLPEGQNWEVKYQEKLQSGYGFDAPEIIARILDKKGKNDQESSQLKSVLGKFGQLLRETGVKTQQDANEQFGADYIDPELKKLL